MAKRPSLLREYLAALGERSWWLVVGLMGGIGYLSDFVLKYFHRELVVPRTVPLLIGAVALLVAQFLAFAQMRKQRNDATDSLEIELAARNRLPDLSAILEAQLLQANTTILIESRLQQLYTTVDQDKLTIQSLRAIATELSAKATPVIGSSVKIATAALELDQTLRNQILLLVAELHAIRGKITINPYPMPTLEEIDVGAYKDRPEEVRVRQRSYAWHQRKALDHWGEQLWPQYLEIYQREFAERIKATISALQTAGVASKKLIAFPEEVVGDHIPLGVPSQLIPELLSAADALSRQQPS